MIKNGIRTRIGRIAAAVAAAALISTVAVPAASAQSTGAEPTQDQVAVSGPLDPKTFAGKVLIATSAGEVLVSVDAGELLDTAATLREDVAKGELTATSIKASNVVSAAASGGCSTWQNAVAGPGVSWNSTNGCAVFGYPGYKRQYSWQNQSDVSLCVMAKGWNASAAAAWYTLTCSSGTFGQILWGNVLAYTQVRGKSLSAITGAAYRWWD